MSSTMLSTLIFDTGSLTNIGAYWFGQAGWLASPRDPAVCMAGFCCLIVYEGARDKQSGSHACMTSTLSTKPFFLFHNLKISQTE